MVIICRKNDAVSFFIALQHRNVDARIDIGILPFRPSACHAPVLRRTKRSNISSYFLQVEPKNRTGPAWLGSVEITLVITAVDLSVFCLQYWYIINNNNNNKHDNVYGAVIMAEPLREFTRFI